VQLLLPSCRVLMEKRCHHVLFECLPLRLLGCMLPRTSENPQNANFALTEFSEVGLPGDGVPGIWRELAYSIDKGGPTSSKACEPNTLRSSSRSGVLLNFARSSKNASISPAGCKAAISLPVPSPT
jgi:hypothetical protein